MDLELIEITVTTAGGRFVTPAWAVNEYFAIYQPVLGFFSLTHRASGWRAALTRSLQDAVDCGKELARFVEMDLGSPTLPDLLRDHPSFPAMKAIRDRYHDAAEEAHLNDIANGEEWE